ncbi:hypothetical protein [Algoriphagus sp.]|uniref:hypothetical protein n=1 Tax=Algoriphagus sp. TaxID=1872435 RepID=UPI003293F47B
MKNLFSLLFVFTFLACSKEKEPIQGKFEDFVSGEMSFERDAETGFMGFLGTVNYQSNEAAYTQWNGIYKFYDPKTGRKLGVFQIPKEGPMALKGGAYLGKAYDDFTIVASNHTGNTNIYKGDSVFNSFQLDMSHLDENGYFSFPMSGNALHQVAEGEYELTFDPFNFMSFRTDEDGFDLSFGAWIATFDEQGNWLCKTDFKAPYDESYENSSQASSMVRMVENGNSWGMFSYSDSLYQIKDCQVIQRLKLTSVTPITYHPEEFIGNKNSGSWERPEDGSINYRLIHDQTIGMNVRMTLVKQVKGDPEIKDPRQRMYLDENTYLLLVYDSAWELRGELEIVYPQGTRFENIFSTSEGLFINKPEQKSEDEYEFWKVDLSGFAD